MNTQKQKVKARQNLFSNAMHAKGEKTCLHNSPKLKELMTSVYIEHFAYYYLNILLK